jgi:hypothetical protein
VMSGLARRARSSAAASVNGPPASMGS